MGASRVKMNCDEIVISDAVILTLNLDKNDAIVLLFQDMKWESLLNRKLKAPFIPTVVCISFFSLLFFG